MVIGGLAAVAATVLALVVAASAGSGGGDDDTSTGGNETSSPSPTSAATRAGTCFVQSNPASVAHSYVSAAEMSMFDDAQACVYQGSVPTSVAERIVGRNTHYNIGDGRGPFVFIDDKDGTKITVTVTQEPDGKYWVTDVSVS